MAIKQPAAAAMAALRLAVARRSWNDARVECETPAILPTTVLTGFLGSGKTSFLRRALADARFTDTAVVVNEIGAVAIDHYLVDFVEGAVLELPGGCLCCAVREDLAQTLRDLIDRRDSRAVAPFRRIVVETSGLADPAPILYTLGADPMLDACLSLGRVVTMIDAVDGAATLGRFAEATRQAALADALVITKTDLAPVSSALEAALLRLNPGAERIVGHVTMDPGHVLFGGRSPQPATTGSSLPRAGGKIAGAGDVAMHSHGIDTFTLILGGAITRLEFAKALGALAGAYGSDLLRVKGIVAFADREGQPALVQAAQHTMFAPEWFDDWPDDDRRSRLVFIVHDIPPGEILAQFAFAMPAIVKTPARRPHIHV